jgi:hypothetical protein
MVLCFVPLLGLLFPVIVPPSSPSPCLGLDVVVGQKTVGRFCIKLDMETLQGYAMN